MHHLKGMLQNTMVLRIYHYDASVVPGFLGTFQIEAREPNKEYGKHIVSYFGSAD